MVERVGDNFIESFLDRAEHVVLHIDADWNVAHRPVMRDLMRSAATTFGDRIAFGEISFDLPAAGAFCRRLGIANVTTVAYFRGRRLVTMITGRHDVAARARAMIVGSASADGFLAGGRRPVR